MYEYLMLWVLPFLSLPQFLVHSVWILHRPLQAKVREQTMPAQARTHLEGQERASQQGNRTCQSALPRSDSREGKTGTRSSPSEGHPRRECLQASKFNKERRLTP